MTEKKILFNKLKELYEMLKESYNYYDEEIEEIISNNWYFTIEEENKKNEKM